MKRFRALFCLALFCLFLSACEKTPNMTELLRYETESRVYQLRIRDEASFTVTLTTSREQEIFLFTQGETQGVSIEISSAGDTTLCYDGTSFPLPETELLRIRRWRGLFHLSEQNFLWTIRRETRGGIAVYRCDAQGVTVYVDAATRLPLKLISGETEIDVLSCETR